MIIVTGGAGFIGSNLIWALNRRGYRNILVVDELDESEKFKNLHNLYFTDILTPEKFKHQADDFNHASVVFHQGANTTTTDHNGAQLMEQNYYYSKWLFSWCQRHECRFIYASSAAVYGQGQHDFSIKRANENPLNIYGFSKLAFDRFVKQQQKVTQVAGMRYFNVYGPMERHKKRMASVAWHLLNQANNTQKMELFVGSNKFYRDFIYIDDVINVNLFLLDNEKISGLFNVGTGKARSFMEVGQILAELMPNTQINTIPFPQDLQGRYQTFTCANLSTLQQCGYTIPPISLEKGLADYYRHFKLYNGYRISK